MLKRLDITNVHTAPDEALEKYLKRKIGNLDRFLPRQARPSAHAEVRLKEVKESNGHHATCEVTLHVPGEVINVSETTLNMYAAIDIVEFKLRQHIRKYKELHSAASLRHRLTRHLRRRTAEPVES